MNPIIGNTMSGIVVCCCGVKLSNQPMRLCEKHAASMNVRHQPPPRPATPPPPFMKIRIQQVKKTMVRKSGLM